MKAEHRSFGFNSTPNSYAEIPNIRNNDTDFQTNPDGTILAIPRKGTLRNLSLQELAEKLEKSLNHQEKPNGTDIK